MALIRWNPFGVHAWDPLEDMDARWLERMMGDAMQGSMKAFAPAMDIYETKDSVVAELPLAGVDPEKVEISIEDNTLTVKGGSEQKTEVDEKNYYRREVRHGSFYRAVTLPVPVVKDKASAVSEHGVLKITIPKAPEVKAKTVPVKVKIVSLREMSRRDTKK
jgi:HSP20 family protein